MSLKHPGRPKKEGPLRDKRIAMRITKETYQMLMRLCREHERSAGDFLEEWVKQHSTNN